MPVPNINPAIVSGPWRRGINSLDEPVNLSDESVQWSVNTINRGGVYQTRPGFSFISGSASFSPPRGLKLFTPLNKEPVLVVAEGLRIRVSPYPFKEWTTLGIYLDDTTTPISMEVAIKGAKTNSDGTLFILGESSYPVLIIQGGKTRPIVWDGIYSPRYSADIPVFDHMKWIGNRLWGAQGNLIRASNILDPFLFTEEDLIAEGGHFMLPAPCTGLGATVDQQSLLAFTHDITTSFQAGILQRDIWLSTKDFKKVLFPDIGCVAPYTIVNQYGMVWWLSQKGFVGIDNALQTYRSSKMKSKDKNMARSKWNISKDVSRACAGSYGNTLMLSVPSGDTWNAHTWVMDEEIVDLIDEETPAEWASVWTGIRPVQWASGNIKGEHRCFVISRDYPRLGDDGKPVAGEMFVASVWEAFCGRKHDLGMNKDFDVVSKDIACSMETKLLGYSPDYKDYGFADIELTQLSGEVSIEVFYASTHSGYKKVLDKDIVATTDSATVTVPIPIVQSYIPQCRTIRTSNDKARLSDLDSGIELGFTRNKSRAFSLLVKWTGQAAIKKIHLFTYPSGDQIEGRVEKDESTARYLLPTGEGNVLTTSPMDSSIISGLTSQSIVSVSPRWSEDFYQSNT